MRNKQLKFKTLGNLAAIIEECREREKIHQTHEVKPKEVNM